MKTLSVVLCQCLGWQPVINAIPFLCWGVIGLVALYLILKYVVQPWKTHQYEMELKDKVFKNEERWHEEKKKADEEELTRKIREFNGLTIHKTILDKVIDKKLDKEITDMKKSIEELQQKYASMDDEIEQIIIKKKQ